MSIEAALLARECLSSPDGRPLFAWNCDEDQRQRLAADFSRLMPTSPVPALTAARFVLWAAEEIRTHHRPGQLTWDWLFGRLGRPAAVTLGHELDRKST